MGVNKLTSAQKMRMDMNYKEHVVMSDQKDRFRDRESGRNFAKILGDTQVENLRKIDRSENKDDRYFEKTLKAIEQLSIINPAVKKTIDGISYKYKDEIASSTPYFSTARLMLESHTFECIRAIVNCLAMDNFELNRTQGLIISRYGTGILNNETTPVNIAPADRKEE